MHNRQIDHKMLASTGFPNVEFSDFTLSPLRTVTTIQYLCPYAVVWSGLVCLNILYF